MVEISNAVKDDNVLLSAHYRSDGPQAVDSIKELIEIY